MRHPKACQCEDCTENRNIRKIIDSIENLPMTKFARKYGHLTFGQIYEELEKAEQILVLFKEAIKEWGYSTKGNDPYTINRYKNFVGREEVRKLMEGE